MRTPECVRRLDPQFRLQRLQKNAKHIQHQRVRGLQRQLRLWINQGAQHNRARAILLRCPINGIYRFFDALRRINEWQRHLIEHLVFELGQECVTQRLGCNAGAIE